MFSEIIIITGHYGCGKTNLAINLALSLKTAKNNVSLADLDIVNPYFRSSDLKESLGQKGINVIASDYMGSTLDIPAVTPMLSAAVNRAGGDNILIIDVGGDDAGATALGRFSHIIAQKSYTMLYVINKYRLLTRAAEEAVHILREIEGASRLKATGIVNNSHLGRETTLDKVLAGMDYGEEVSRLSGLNIVFNTIKSGLFKDLTEKEGFFPVNIDVKAPWD